MLFHQFDDEKCDDVVGGDGGDNNNCWSYQWRQWLAMIVAMKILAEKRIGGRVVSSLA